MSWLTGAFDKLHRLDRNRKGHLTLDEFTGGDSPLSKQTLNKVFSMVDIVSSSGSTEADVLEWSLCRQEGLDRIDYRDICLGLAMTSSERNAEYLCHMAFALFDRVSDTAPQCRVFGSSFIPFPFLSV